MKPILQINHKQRGSRRVNRARRGHQSFPLTDYNYRPTAEAEASSLAGGPATKAPAFHKLSSKFFGAETSKICHRAFVLHSDHWHRCLANRVHAHRSDSPDQELLTGRISQRC